MKVIHVYTRADPASPKARPAKHRVFLWHSVLRGVYRPWEYPKKATGAAADAAAVPRGDAHKRSGRVSTAPQKNQGAAVMV